MTNEKHTVEILRAYSLWADSEGFWHVMRENRYGKWSKEDNISEDMTIIGDQIPPEELVKLLLCEHRQNHARFFNL